MNYSWKTYEDVQEKVEAFDNFCATFGYAYGDKNWTSLYVKIGRKDTHLAEAILEYQQSEYAKVQA